MPYLGGEGPLCRFYLTVLCRFVVVVLCSRRDGLPSTCEALACIDDLPILEGFARGGTPSRSSISELVHSLLAGKKVGDKIDLSVYDTAQELDIRDMTINQMLAQLDMNGGYIHELTPFYKELKCRIVSHPVLQVVMSAPNTRAAKILALASGTGVVRTIDTRLVSKELSIEKGIISRELDDLVRDEKLQKVTPYKLHAQFEVRKVPVSLDNVVDMLYKAAKRMEDQEVSRIQEVVDYLSAKTCQTKLLSERFGDDVDMLKDCGHCAVCHAGGRQAVTIEDEHVRRIGRKLDVRRWALIQAQEGLPRDNPVLWARFAAGIASPAITKKYKKLPGFGTMSDHAWQTLLDAAAAELGVAADT
jgi:ATP-dependent DNA helicase RecQ